jgi:phosphomannomutase
MQSINCFKPYDVRGKLGHELNESIAYRIGNGFARYLNAKQIVIGGDVRLSTEALKSALTKGMNDFGADVIDIGLSGSEELYYAAFTLDVDGGVEITGSHNPVDYNGMKFVGRGALPIGQASGLLEIKDFSERTPLVNDIKKGSNSCANIINDYVSHLLTYINQSAIKPLKIVANSGNGAAGHIVEALEKKFTEKKIPITFVKVQHEADGTFPNGVPNPLLPNCREATSEAVLENKADLGIAWDGDFDRCFLFDETGAFIEGYYTVGLLAEAFLKKSPGEKIVYDPRMIWNTIDIVKANNGIPIECQSGHTFIKERMRKENAIYGGEMSAHHYFRDFAYCDSGMIPWLLVTELLSLSGKRLSQLVNERIQAYPCSGEFNYKVQDPAATIEHVTRYFEKQSPTTSYVDGVSMEFPKWRFNLRASNTETLLRLNVESRGDRNLMLERLSEIEQQIVEID